MYRDINLQKYVFGEHRTSDSDWLNEFCCRSTVEIWHSQGHSNGIEDVVETPNSSVFLQVKKKHILLGLIQIVLAQVDSRPRVHTLFHK